ncbi:hypothetical protein XJ32_08870 [Helicobacter bilis]|uniref:Uncharacterized protein n=1 Tax=Helicobacter bilis TaxID=37372 RepID=A0A1Q2LI89_9HELI|nr:hypothetical protein XJ32_08870 [Helicobacter bilis]
MSNVFMRPFLEYIQKKIHIRRRQKCVGYIIRYALHTNINMHNLTSIPAHTQQSKQHQCLFCNIYFIYTNNTYY